jgi:hypothetical protein
MKTPEETRYRFNLVTLTWEHTPVGKRPRCCNNIVCRRQLLSLPARWCREPNFHAARANNPWKKPNFIFVDEADRLRPSDLRDLQCLELQAHTTRQQIRAIHDRRQARVLEAKRQERLKQDNLFRKMMDDVTFQVWKQILLHGEASIYIGDDCYVISNDDGRPSPELQQFMAHLIRGH